VRVKEIIGLLRDARKAATMGRMSIGAIWRSKLDTAPVKHEDGRIVTEYTLDEFIRERTRLYRETWIIGPISEVLEQLEPKP
jgi:hypothetical protein